jgi:hypothetical protein
MGPKIRARQMWSKSSTKTDFAQQVTTWLLPFIFTTANQTSFHCKAGNKSYGLSAGSSSESGGPSSGISEAALKRKYRFSIFSFPTLIYMLIFTFLNEQYFYILTARFILSENTSFCSKFRTFQRTTTQNQRLLWIFLRLLIFSSKIHHLLEI